MKTKSTQGGSRKGFIMKNTIISKAIKMATAFALSVSVMATTIGTVPAYAMTSYKNWDVVQGRGRKYTTVYTNGEDTWINVSIKGAGSGFYLYDGNGRYIYGETNAIADNSNRWFFLGKDHAVYKVYVPFGYVGGNAKVTVTKSSDCRRAVIE